jgi:4-amino-4-deoxy-L-arabinose transferase-like glycosyltransferase
MTATTQDVVKDAETPAGRRWAPWALTLICLGAGALYAWKIGAGQFGNTYYSAAVKSMTEGFTNFLFGSFDPYGVVTVDKPPMSLWPQVISVLIFGFHGWALLLPQVIEGVAAVFLLHRTVRLWAGENVALLAAVILALTPVTVVINRDNNPDTLLVLLLVAAAYAVTRSVLAASARGRTTWLLWCAFFIGCGFVTKMLQAWIIVPALAIAFLAGAGGPLRRRLLDLLGAGLVLIVSSFWWIALHDWWPGTKPYIGSSTDGTAWDLVFGYNGFGRIFGQGGGTAGGGVITTGGGTTVTSFGGDTGAGRMFNDVVGGQISWLLPLSLLVLVVLGVHAISTRSLGDPARRAGWLLWGGWLLVTAVVFSFAEGTWHPYYTTAMAPAVAAISSAGLALLWRRHRRLGLPLALAISAAWAFVLISRDVSWYGWTRWAVVVTAAFAIGGLVVARRGLGRPALAAGLVSLLLTPAVWSAAAAQSTSAGTLPAAGPAVGPGSAAASGPVVMGGGPVRTSPSGGGQPGPFGGGQPAQSGGGQPRLVMIGGSDGTTTLTDEQRRILDYAKKNGDAPIPLAVNGDAGSAAPFIIDSDATVIGMGGFGGRDNAPSIEQLARWVTDGTLEFVLSGAANGGTQPDGPIPSGVQQERQRWIEQHCTVVDPSAYGGKAAQSGGGGPVHLGVPDTLYHC